MDAPTHCRITIETLLDYIDDRADERTREEVRAHVDADCPRCAPQVAALQRLMPALREAMRYQAPEPVVERAKAIYRERFRKPARMPLIARLISDSRTGFAFAGARGAERTGIRMVFATEEHDIDLWHEPESEGTWYIIGQAVARNTGQAIVPDLAELTSDSGEKIEATAEAGEFHLSDVPPGTYRLSLALEQADIVLQDVKVGE